MTFHKGSIRSAQLRLPEVALHTFIVAVRSTSSTKASRGRRG
jgi:hypothetical protein